MRKISMETNILIISFVLLLLGIIIFGALWNIDSSWILGWIIGAPASMIGYLVGIMVLTILLKKKSKTKGIWLTFFRVIITFLFQGILFVGIVLVDKNAHGLDLWSGRNINVMYSPINIFTYLGGVGIVAASTLIASIVTRKKGRK